MSRRLAMVEANIPSYAASRHVLARISLRWCLSCTGRAMAASVGRKYALLSLDAPREGFQWSAPSAAPRCREARRPSGWSSDDLGVACLRIAARLALRRDCA